MNHDSYIATIRKYELVRKIGNKVIELEETLKQQPVKPRAWYNFSRSVKMPNISRSELTEKAMNIILDEEVAKLSNEFEKDTEIRERLKKQYYDEYALFKRGVLPDPPRVEQEELTGSPDNFDGNWRRGGYRRRKNKTRSKKTKRSRKTRGRR
jgi:hypothetical protein